MKTMTYKKELVNSVRQAFFFTILASLFTLNGCNKVIDFDQTTDEGAVRFTSEIATTRASGSAWENGDEVGIYMIDNTTKEVFSNNIKYISSAAGEFSVAPNNPPIYYPVSGNVDFVAYYPYAPLSNNTYDIDVADQSDLPKIDLIWSNNLTEISKNKNAQNLIFKHKLANMELTIKKGDGITDADLAGLKVTLKDINTTAQFEVLAGTIGKQANSANVLFNTSSDGISSEAIILPGEISGKVMEFEITQGALTGLKFESTFPNTTLVEGTKSKYTVTVTRTAVIFSGAIITDWGDGGNSDLVGGEVI